jgi:hypothetical protein
MEITVKCPRCESYLTEPKNVLSTAAWVWIILGVMFVWILFGIIFVIVGFCLPPNKIYVCSQCQKHF